MKTDSSAFRRYLVAGLDNIKETVALLGIDGAHKATLLLANKAFHSMTGYKTDTIGKNIFEFVDPSRHKFLKKQLERMITYRQPVEYTIWARVPAGRRAFQVEMIPVVKSRQKEVKEVIVLLQDVTALAKLQEEVRALRAAGYKTEDPKVQD